MVLQQKRPGAAYGFLNEGASPEEFELFIMIPLREGKTAQFKTEKYISGLTLLNVELEADSDYKGEAYLPKHFTLKPAAVDSLFDPETSLIRIVVSNGAEVTVSEFSYKDAGTTRIEYTEVIDGVYYNTPYIHMAELKNDEGKLILAPKVLMPVNGFFPSHTEEVAESVENNIYKSVLVLTPDESIERKVIVPESVNEIQYPSIDKNEEGYFSTITLKAQNHEEAKVLLNRAILDDLEEAQENKTRKGRVRKRRTATRGESEEQKDNGSKSNEKKETPNKPPRKGKVRKKYTRTRDLEPIVKPKEE